MGRGAAQAPNEQDEEWEGADCVDNFYVHICGGPSAKKRCGVAANAVAGYARHGVPRQWAKVYRYPRQREYSFRKYGKENAHQLAREYCRRANYFYMKFFKKTVEDFEYTFDDITEYTETQEFVAFVDALDQPSDLLPAKRTHCKAAVYELRNFIPLIGPVVEDEADGDPEGEG